YDGDLAHSFHTSVAQLSVFTFSQKLLALGLCHFRHAHDFRCTHSQMVNIYLESFWLALPAFAANMAPVIVQKLHAFEKLNVPIDGGKSLFGKRIFGEHKTVRGLLIGTLAGIFIVAVQYAAVNFFELPFAHLHSLTEFLLFGALSGFGALMGDAIESFFKRQIGIG